MSISISKKIITDNLFFCFDAGNLLSYPGSGTIVRDVLLQQTYGTMGNTSIYNNGNFRFLSSDRYDIIIFGTSDFVEQKSFTVCAWYKPLDTTVQAIIGRDIDSSSNRCFKMYCSDGCYLTGSLILSPYAFTALSLSTPLLINSWNYCVYTFEYYNGSYGGACLYMFNSNGLTKNYYDGYSSERLMINNCRMDIGASSNGAHKCNGYMNLVKYYNGKALTEEECYINYNASKERFGL